VRCPNCADSHTTMIPRTRGEALVIAERLSKGDAIDNIATKRKCHNCGCVWTTNDAGDVVDILTREHMVAL
jgi:hypothetical protein